MQLHDIGLFDLGEVLKASVSGTDQRPSRRGGELGIGFFRPLVPPRVGKDGNPEATSLVGRSRRELFSQAAAGRHCTSFATACLGDGVHGHGAPAPVARGTDSAGDVDRLAVVQDGKVAPGQGLGLENAAPAACTVTAAKAETAVKGRARSYFGADGSPVPNPGETRGDFGGPGAVTALASFRSIESGGVGGGGPPGTSAGLRLRIRIEVRRLQADETSIPPSGSGRASLLAALALAGTTLLLLRLGSGRTAASRRFAARPEFEVWTWAYAAYAAAAAAVGLATSP